MAVYVVQDEVTGMVKIGRAKDPSQRLRGLQTSHCNRLFLRDLLAGGSKEEILVHQHFAAYRKRGEWFAIPDDILDQDLPVLRAAIAEMSAIVGSNAPSPPRVIAPYEEPLTPDWTELQAILAKASRRTPFTQYLQENYEELSALIDKHGAHWKVIARWAVEEGHTNGQPLSGDSARKSFERETARRGQDGVYMQSEEAR